MSEGVVHQPLPHDSADLHVAGAAAYVDDLPEPPGLLHCAFGLATEGPATLVSLDLDAVRAAPGVVGRVSKCGNGWCYLDVKGRGGFVEISHIWGVDPVETIE